MLFLNGSPFSANCILPRGRPKGMILLHRRESIDQTMVWQVKNLDFSGPLEYSYFNSLINCFPVFVRSHWQSNDFLSPAKSSSKYCHQAGFPSYSWFSLLLLFAVVASPTSDKRCVDTPLARRSLGHVTLSNWFQNHFPMPSLHRIISPSLPLLTPCLSHNISPPHKLPHASWLLLSHLPPASYKETKKHPLGDTHANLPSSSLLRPEFSHRHP